MSMRSRLACLREHTSSLAALWRPHRDRAALRAFQERKLRFLLARTWREVPFYRQRWTGAGLSARTLPGLADLARLPLVDKAALRAAPLARKIARDHRDVRLITRYTAGSTGEPTRVRRAPLEEHLVGQFRLRASLALGRRVAELGVYVGSPGVPTDRKSASLRRVRDALRLFPFREVDCLRAPDAVVAEVLRLRPAVIAGYPGALAEVAARWPAPGFPRLVFTGGELLTPGLRRALGEGFGAPVRDLYGAHECNLVAWECPEAGGLHVCEDNIVLELLCPDGTPAAVGEPGEVVLTALHSYASPYVRYRLGDTAVRGTVPCPCGAAWARIEVVRGRSMDTCALPGGRRMHHWELIPMAFWDMPWHRTYQLVQTGPARFVLRVVLCGEPPAEDLRRVEAAVAAKLGPQGQFAFAFVDAVERSEGGKNRLCISPFGQVPR